MSDYTPNYGSAREMYAYGADSFHGTDSRPGNRAEFDRFIAKVKADALREAAEGVTEIDGRRDDAAATWLNDRADRIESGDGQ